MGNYSKLSEELKRQLVDEVKKGGLIKEVAAAAKVHVTTLKYWVKKVERGAPLSNDAKTRRTYTVKEKRAAVARLGKESADKISADLNVATSMIYHWRKALTKGDLKDDNPDHPRTKRYNAQFKKNVLQARRPGESDSSLAKRFGLNNNSIADWQNKALGKNFDAMKKPKVTVISHGPRADIIEHQSNTSRNVVQAIGLIRQQKKNFNMDDPVHVTMAVVLMLLEGKM